ncbi:methyltransferase family protein [Spirosoma endophyticum]|uniref:Protein-S-isoprenylcysteine O-methyltransferase Ste14 n=1 Tax=Spirosoma endophyticum TaxID=662367 RepID=A0A1I2FBL2_9BACT|nr:isoprenylcysteine carboxylmethyltransferase family protein [Spirosoma endophyticum]SFF02782.1 Protein-S-isoprenylcysteine O-methyltransferase Ste14 [Spirosoma endophyticum]
MSGYIAIGLSWLLFGLLHSLTATHWFKQWVQSVHLIPQPYYRLIYNGIALITFLPVLLTLQEGPVDWLGSWRGSAWIGSLLIVSGSLVGLLAFKEYDIVDFLGWPMNSPLKESAESEGLRQDGLLRYVRHPLYLGTISALLGLLANQPDWKHLMFSLVAFTYLRIGIYFEERKLVKTFGEAYLRYQHQVPMLFPYRFAPHR